MKKILLIAGGVIISAITAYFAFSDSEAPKDISQQLKNLEQKFQSGEISEYEDARMELSDLKAICEGYVTANEFSTDQEDIRNIAHYKTLIQRITEKEQQIAQEEELFNSIPWGSQNQVEMLEKISTYLNNYPKGVKYKYTIDNFRELTVDYMQRMASEFESQTLALESNTTQPINSLFHMASLNKSGGEEQQQEVDLTNMNFDQAFEKYNQSKRVITILAKADFGNAELAVTPQTLRQQMEEYEEKLKYKKQQQEALFRKMITQSIVDDGWEVKARKEMHDYVVRDRATGFAACDWYDLTINIAQAENFKINIFSNRVEVDLHYNVNSICNPTLKYKYYDGTFLLVLPVINGKLGEGYFKSRDINRTE
ncbi:hypothetical protein [Microcystis phage Mwe-JY31]